MKAKPPVGTKIAGKMVPEAQADLSRAPTRPSLNHLEITMQILLNTDTHIDGRQAMSDHLETVVNEALGHYGERLTRVEAHVADVNSANKAGPNDIQCTLEARPKGRDPIVVKDRAGSAHQAIQGAVNKLVRALGSSFEKLDQRTPARPQ
jgi:ribosome-associated translation inhibitor RaiA